MKDEIDHIFCKSDTCCKYEFKKCLCFCNVGAWVSTKTLMRSIVNAVALKLYIVYGVLNNKKCKLVNELTIISPPIAKVRVPF
jgi:hypothetical protein